MLFRQTGPHRPACRLTEAEALDIAARAIGGRTGCHVREVVQVGGRIEWHIGTATIGSGTVVRISDATGDVIACDRWGVR